MMKLISRIVNLVIAATAVVATVLLFSLAPLSFNSKVVVEVDTIAQAIPETDYTKDIKASELLGTEEIQAGIKFKLSFADVKEAKGGNKEVMNDRLLKGNLESTLLTLEEAIDVLADNTIRKALNTTIKEEVKKQIENAKADNEQAQKMSADDILNYLGLGEEYFKNFTIALYSEANRKNATPDSVGNVLLEQTDEVIVRAERSGVAKAGAFTDEQKNSVKSGLNTILNQLDMINEDGTIKPLNDLPYIYAIKYIQKELTGKVSNDQLKAQTGETTRDHSNRLLELYVFDLMPEEFYTVVEYVSLGVIIAMFVLAGIWLFLAAYEVLAFLFPQARLSLIKVFLWPLFGIASIVQILLGFVLTGVFKYVVPEAFDLSTLKIPVKEVILVPRTFALGTSIVVIVTIGLLIVSFALKKIAYQDEGKSKKETAKNEEK